MRYIKIPNDLNARIAAGEALIRVSATAYKSGTANRPSEWQAFDKDPAAWIHKQGYRLVGPGAPADGTIPPNLLRIVPVYDTANTMYVRIPFIGNIDRNVNLPDGTEYEDSFPAFLSTYFTRHCR